MKQTDYTSNDYYAFGGLIPGRHTQTSAYRLGFNGKENDNELLGEGHSQDYGFRPYLPALGRFFSPDPLIQKYPELTPFQFASNTPIAAVDLDGLEGISYNHFISKCLGITTATEQQLKYNLHSSMSDNTRTRVSPALNGVKNTVFGVAGAVGAFAAINTAPIWLVGGALTLSISEVSVGASQTLDATFNQKFDPNSTLHQFQNPVGLVMGHNNSEYAKTGDAVTGFLPGMVTGGNILGTVLEGKSILENGPTASKLVNFADGWEDTESLYEAVTEFQPKPAATIPLQTIPPEKADGIIKRQISPGPKMTNEQVKAISDFINTLESKE